MSEIEVTSGGDDRHVTRAPRRRRRQRMILLRQAILWSAVLLFLHLSGCMERMFYHPEHVGPNQLAAANYIAGARDVRFQSRDGTRLHGWFIPSQAGSDAPTILHVHGNAGNLRGHVFFTEHLPPAGFNVFIFDYRGYGESEGSPTRRGPLLDDANAALDAMLALPEVDPSRIGLYGQSLGGAIAILLMAQRSEFRAAVFESPFCSWRDAAATAVGGANPGFLSKTLATLLISDEMRPLDAVGKINRPMLFLHGDHDTIIPIVHSRRLVEAAERAERPVAFHVMPDGEHNTLRETHPEMDELTIEFLRTHLETTRNVPSESSQRDAD